MIKHENDFIIWATFDHARPLKAPFVLPPRPGRRTHCAGTGGVATLPRAVPRNVPRPPSSPESAAERPRGVLASPQHPVQHIVVRFRRPKHLFHMLRGGTRLGPEVLTSARRAATGAQSTNPATVPPPAKLFCSVRTINLESAAERARSFGVDTHFSGASGAARLSSAAPRAVLGPQVLWRGPRSGRGVFWRVQHLVQHPTPKALLSSAP